MKETKVDSEYYHKVVDCQYACPAHTPVPDYIRLIAKGNYTEAYMLNRHSNVFPGILGRVCDRPCEPACRRNRVDDEPVAICRLKRAAADLKGPFQHLLPKVPEKKLNKKIALIGAGPVSLTVANDLQPLGYECVIFEKDDEPGGAMKSQVPGFRLPQKVLDEEIGVILDMGVRIHYNSPIQDIMELVDSEEFDAIFIGCGAPLGKSLQLDGQDSVAEFLHIGLEFLPSVRFHHRDEIGENVIVVGGGNTAMDCSRTAKRLGAKSVKVVAPESYDQMLASQWEKEDAEEEGIVMKNNILPARFSVDGNGNKFLHLDSLTSCYDENGAFNPQKSGAEEEKILFDHVIMAIGQSTSFPFISEKSGISFSKTDSTRLEVDEKTFQTSLPQIFCGGDAAFGPKNIITAIAHGHEVAISIHQYCQGKDVNERLEQGMNLISQKMAFNFWDYANGYDELERQKVPAIPLGDRTILEKEVELGFDIQVALSETSRCLNCDVQTVFESSQCIECDACIDICPVECLTLTPDFENEEDLRKNLTVPAENKDQDLLLAVVPQTSRLMVKDENVCLHCGLCAERCPTDAWDMQKWTLKLPQAASYQENSEEAT